MERIYGIHNGGNDKVTRANNVQSGFTQEDLANQTKRIYGIREGSANPKGTEVGTSSSNGTSREMTQQDLAAQFGVDINTLKRAKSLTTLPTLKSARMKQEKTSQSPSEWNTL